MKYLIIPLLILASIHPLSYAKYNWGKKNKLGAVGSVLLAVAALIIPSILLFSR